MTALIYAICGVVGFVVFAALLYPLRKPIAMSEEEARADELIASLRRENPAP